MKPCPECGKPLDEQEGWPGLWKCPDYTCINPDDGPPFEFKCRGMEVTDEAADAFDDAVLRLIAERN